MKDRATQILHSLSLDPIAQRNANPKLIRVSVGALAWLMRLSNGYTVLSHRAGARRAPAG